MKRQTRWAIGTAILLAGVGSYLLATQRGHAPAASAITENGDATAGMGRATAALPALLGLEPAPIATPRARDPLDPQAQDEVQLCGGAWVKVADDGSIDDRALWKTDSIRAATQSIVARLAGSSNEFERATAWWLQTLIEDAKTRSADAEETFEPRTTVPADDTERASRSELVSSRVATPTSSGPEQAVLRQQAVANRDQAIQRLARQAVDSTDPRVYALASRACARSPADGYCGLLSARQWARLDPDNAWPWLQILSEASSQRDIATRNEALYRVAAANRLRADLDDAPAAVAHAADGDGSLVAAMSLALVTFNALTDLAPYRAIRRACLDVKDDVNLNQTCGNVANVLLNGSTNLLDRVIGASVGRQAGWPADVVDRVRAETLQMQTASIATAASRTDVRTAGCRELRKELARFDRRVELGEVGMARAALAAHPSPIDEAMKEARRRREQEDEEERSRATRPPAPSSNEAGASSPR